MKFTFYFISWKILYYHVGRFKNDDDIVVSFYDVFIIF